jgi:hypothetical protein
LCFELGSIIGARLEFRQNVDVSQSLPGRVSKPVFVVMFRELCHFRAIFDLL